jgi:iSTAND domain-containing protein/adenylate/guanylate cyclase family protein
MPSQSDESPPLPDYTGRALEVAHVLFMDVVAYSLLPMDHQSDVICQLQDVVRGIPDFKHAQSNDALICLPTGDGMALAFFGDLTAPMRFARQIALALKNNSRFQIRLGVHTGPVYRLADINTNRNISGGGINFAQRVMDCGDGGHILISKTTAEMLAQLSSWQGTIHDLGEVEVKHGVRIQIFNVFTEEFGNPQIPSRVRRSTHLSSDTEPNLGPLVAKMCDRRAQEEEFRDTFLNGLECHPGIPQIYVIPGEEGQCHASMVQRLIDRVNRSQFRADRCSHPTGRVKKVPWQYDGELRQRVARLIYSLFETFGATASGQPINPRNLSAPMFGALVEASLNTYIAIEHEVHASRWDSIAANLLANYIKFWNGLPGSPNRPTIFVFISIVFPRPQRSLWRRILFLNSVGVYFRRKRIRRAVKALEQTSAAPFRVLAELPPLTREDVLEWFSLNHIHESEEKRMKAVDRLFQGGELPKAMWEIEAFCADEMRSFAAERGYDERWRVEQKALFGRRDTGLEARSAATAV